MNSQKQKIKIWMGAAAVLIILFSPVLGIGVSLVLSAIALMTFIFFIHRLDPTYLKLHKKEIIHAIIIALVVAAAVIVVMRIFSNEDDWMCSGGQWVKHGNPSAPMPTQPCGR